MAYTKDGSIILKKKTATGRDNRGNPVYIPSEREVPAKITSTTQSEFFQAGQAGMRAEYLFEINPAEYQGERLVIYEGDELSIYRKYQSEIDKLELYAGKEVGL